MEPSGISPIGTPDLRDAGGFLSQNPLSSIWQLRRVASSSTKHRGVESYNSGLDSSREGDKELCADNLDFHIAREFTAETSGRNPPVFSETHAARREPSSNVRGVQEPSGKNSFLRSDKNNGSVKSSQKPTKNGVPTFPKPMFRSYANPYDSMSDKEADYTLDDSFWNEENPVGEVERLLLEYRQNQELVRNIGAHYYQIIYPVQLRHHEKMGISTREVGAPKFPPREGGNAQPGYGNTSRSRSRTGKHFHRTSLLIKAFNHKFRLDLELNTQLLAPNLMQKHYLPSGAEQVSKQEIEHCYYHGTVKDYPGATAAFHTCNGVSGVIHVGNETFVIHPFYGGDLSKHPHVIFEARTKANKGCGLQGNTDWRGNTYRRTKHVSGGRFARDVSEATKYIETALVIDKAMFEKRNGSTRSEVVHDAIQVANIADLYFRTLNTRVSVVYIETWQDRNHASIEKGDDIGKALLNFIDYSSRQLYRVDKDTTQLLTGDNFKGGEAGISVPDVVCTPKAVGISVDVNPYELHLLAGTMAHMIGHNIGMSHDGQREDCICRDWHGCIMAQTIVGRESVQPYTFSECSKTDYNGALRTGHGICLLNKPNELETKRTCGNSIVEEGEDCDCGAIHDCQDQECCDPYTCKLRKDAQCATGPCCKNCTLRSAGTVCREATNECDLPEHCTGDMGQCPPDVHKKNGVECDNKKAYCFNGLCPTLNAQCNKVWGFGADAADLECFMQFNSKGSYSGHCGTDSEKNYVKCDNENARCGSLHCQNGMTTPQIGGIDKYHYSTTIISIKGKEYECKTLAPSPADKGTNQFSGLVWDGTPCGNNLICINQTCTSLYPHVGSGKCPSNDPSSECSGKGVCTNLNKCYCELGWEGPDCSQVADIVPMEPEPTSGTEEHSRISLEEHMKKKETPYENSHSTNTVFLVGSLMSVVGGVFIVFALSALCYRRSTMPKPDPPSIKKPGIAPKGLPAMPTAPSIDEAAGIDSSKMLSFGNMPSFRSSVRVSECRTGKCRHNWDDSLSCSSCELLGLKSGRDPQRVLYNRHNHMGTAPPTGRFQEHKMQQMKRLGVGSGSEDDPGHSGEEETVSFIDLPPNNLAKLPEKGILKKPCPYGGEELPCHKGKWLDDAQSDAQEMLSQSGDPADMLSSGPISEVERNLKSLNSYHEDILEALRTAAARHHPGSGPGSATASSDDLLRRSLAAAAALDSSYNRVNSQDKLCDPSQYPADHLLSRHGSQTHVVMVENNSPTPSGHHHHRRTNHRTDNQADDEDDEEVHPVGPIRIRNLEDLIRQLEHKTTRHMSPSGSEDIRMSETEADRHYNRLDSQGGRVRGNEFGYGRYRHGPGSSGSGRGYLPEEEGIYESADQDRGPPPDTPDSESDDFIQAQPRLVQLGSNEERVGYSPPESPVRHEDSPSPHNDQSALLPGPKYPEYKH